MNTYSFVFPHTYVLSEFLFYTFEANFHIHFNYVKLSHITYHMDFEVQLCLGNDNWYPIHLTVRQKLGEIYFDFGSAASPPIITDRFFSFRQIQIGNSADPLVIKFFGSVTRAIRFSSDRDLSNIWLYLQRFISIPNIEQPNEMFSFKPKKAESSNDTDPPTASPLFAKKLKEFEKNDRIPEIPSISAKVDFASSSSIQFLDKTQSLVTPEHLVSVLNGKKLANSYLISTLEFSHAAIAKVFSMSLLPDDFEESKLKYTRITKQWKNMSRDQWCNNTSFRRYVLTLESNLDTCHVKSDTLRMLIYESMISCMFSGRKH